MVDEAVTKRVAALPHRPAEALQAEEPRVPDGLLEQRQRWSLASIS
jgi:hypothetical protein